jgi:hypothetical protein
MADEPEIAEGGEGTNVSLTELLEQVLTITLQSMAGPVIGKVDAYDSAKNRVSITPLVPLLVAGEVVPSPKLPSVPVAWPSLGSMSIKFPLAAGAYMELHPLGHDHHSWLTDGAERLPPTNERRFSLSDLVAVPLAPSPLATPPDPTSYDAAWAVLFGQLKVGSSAATDFAALASKVLTELQAIKTAYDLHTHAYNPGPGSSTPTAAPLNPLPAPSSVAATKLMAI